MKKYILALDEGTTSARAVLYNKDAQVLYVAQHEFPQIYPQPGWVEHNPMDIFTNQYVSMTECILQSGINPDEIAGIGITNQRETTIVWEKSTGKPIYNAIVWQCRRTAPIVEALIENGHAERIVELTGLHPDAYFSATKIQWILENVEGAREMADKGDLLFGTVDTWLIWKLSGGRIHVTDRTNASRTMLCNLKTGDWDSELLELFHIPMSMMPKICSSSEVYGNIDVLGTYVPVCGIAGDQQAALFGQGCFSAGDAKNTYGTGCFFLAHTGTEPIRSRNGLITTIAATCQGDPLEYALEGSVFVGGAVIQWLRDELRIISDAKDSEYFAKKVEDTGGVYVVPAFSGLGAPYWDMHARGTVTGLTRGTGLPHIIRAALESIAYQTNDVMLAIREDMGKDFTSLRVDGGASANNFLMQFQSDISNIEVRRPRSVEATSLGAAFLAGLAIGFFKDKKTISKLLSYDSTFKPVMDANKRTELLDGWHMAIGASRTHH